MVTATSELATFRSICSHKSNPCLTENRTSSDASQEGDYDFTRSLSQTKSHALTDNRAEPLIRISEPTDADSHVATATSCAILTSHSYTSTLKRCYSQDSDILSEKPRQPSWFNDSLFKSISNPPRSFQLRHSHSTGVDRHTPMHLIKTVSTKSLRSAHVVIDVKTFYQTYPKPNINSPPVKQAPPRPKTLRRKKRLPFYRSSIPRPDSTPSSTFSNGSLIVVSQPQSICLWDDHFPDLRRQPKPRNQIHASSRSQPTNVTQLGYPSRPLYTAIRPNMSPVKTSSGTPQPSDTRYSVHTSRPISLPTPSRAASPGIISIPSTSALHGGDGAGFEPFAHQSRPSSRHSCGALPSAFGMMSQRRNINGFSLSGETELKMVLAESGGEDSHDAFRFKNMGKRRGSFNVMKKIRELRKGIKEFVLRNRHH
ncbi:hypothetical protein J132_07661 [Termitomyces sp. J132]|nr:hypothetical protein J132_07661 [Termitomyces sp. J132]